MSSTLEALCRLDQKMNCRIRLGATAAAGHPVDLENVPDDSVTTSSSRAMRAKPRVASFVAGRVESRPNALRVKRNSRGDRATATALKAARGDANRFLRNSVSVLKHKQFLALDVGVGAGRDVII